MLSAAVESAFASVTLFSSISSLKALNRAGYSQCIEEKCLWPISISSWTVLGTAASAVSNLKDDIGVDIVGDIFDDDVFQKIKEQNFKCIFCCNFLEHVTNPGDLIVRCMQLIPVGGYIVFTVPYSYPYHRDPIDTMFRPAPDELASLIPSHKVISSEIINTGSYRDHLAKSPWKIFRHIRIFFPFFGFEKWKRSLIKLKWLYFDFKHTCLIVQKK